LAYDPQGEAVFAIFKNGGARDEKSTVMRFSDHQTGHIKAWDHHNKAHVAGQVEMKSKEEQALGERAEGEAREVGAAESSSPEVSPPFSTIFTHSQIKESSQVADQKKREANSHRKPHYLKP
jgi:hypothetical protein